MNFLCDHVRERLTRLYRVMSKNGAKVSSYHNIFLIARILRGGALLFLSVRAKMFESSRGIHSKFSFTLHIYH